MGKVSTNTTDRKSEALPANVVDVFVMADFPAPASGVITLDTNTEYRIKAALSFSDRFVIPASGFVDFVGEAGLINTLTYTGTDILFSSTAAIGRLVLTNLSFIATSPAADIYDLTGLAAFGAMRAISCQFTGFDAIGTRTGFFFAQDLATFYGNFNVGMTFQDVNTVALDRMLAQMDGTGSVEAVSIQGTLTQNVTATICSITANGSEDAFFIEPDIDPDAVVRINGCIKVGTGNFFKPGVTGAIANITEGAFSSETISAVADNGGGLARFTFAAPPTLYVNQDVTISGYTTNTAYNGTFRVIATTASTFDVAVFFGTNEAGGSFTGNRITCADIGHGLSTGTTIVIFNTVNYDGPAIIFNVNANDFMISRTFVIDETADWDTGSLDETDKRMFVFDNGAQKDSETIGSMIVSGNAVPTVISGTGFFDFALGGLAVEASNNERWRLTNATTGEIRYDGQNPISAMATVNMVVTPNTSARFNFRMVKNGSPLPDASTASLAISGTLQTVTFIAPITAVNGDLFRMQVEEISATVDPLISDMTMDIE